MRYLWSIPAAVIAWFVVGFAPTYLNGLPEASTTFVAAAGRSARAGRVRRGSAGRADRRPGPDRGAAGGWSLPAGVWWLSGNALSAKGLLATLLVASARRRVLRCPGHPKFGGRRVRAGPAGRLVRAAAGCRARGLALALAAQRPAGRARASRCSCTSRAGGAAGGRRTRGCRWPRSYVASFAIVEAIQRSPTPKGRIGRRSRTPAPTRSSTRSSRCCASTGRGSSLAVLLAIPMVALKLRALPPPPPPPSPYDDRTQRRCTVRRPRLDRPGRTQTPPSGTPPARLLSQLGLGAGRPVAVSGVTAVIWVSAAVITTAKNLNRLLFGVPIASVV